MKRSLLLGTLILGLVGCGGDGSGDTFSARRDVEDWLDDLEFAYDEALFENTDSGIRGRFLPLVSANYCQDGRDQEYELNAYLEEVLDAQELDVDDVRIVGVDIRNARYRDADRVVEADVQFRAEFYDGGQREFQVTFTDENFRLSREGGRYRVIGNDDNCGFRVNADGTAAVKSNRVRSDEKTTPAPK